MRQPIDIQITINGETQSLSIEPQRSLLEVLREDLGLIGAKEGCSTGDCGACTVLLDGKPVTSCLVLAPEAHGREVQTVEGLAQDGQLHPLQESFMAHGGLQCGICTPGFLMTAKALLDRNPQPTEAQVREAIAGNLCRCTGYDKIVRAILATASELM